MDMPTMNPVNWFEIPCTDLARAKSFYSAVFGTQFPPEDMDMGTDSMAFFPGAPELPNGMGALVSGKEQKPSMEGVTIYFYCDNCEEELNKVEAAGGKVIMPKMSIGEFGFIGMFVDSEGNRIGVHSHAAQ